MPKIFEQAKRTRPHFERLLIVTGLPDAGKSKLLRSMFTDFRLGTRGALPAAAKIPPVPLSNERCLAVRFTSPHERAESLEQFLEKLDRTMQSAWKDYWRFNFACASQTDANGTTPSVVAICQAVRARFDPERIRVVQIDPRQDGEPGTFLQLSDVDALWRERIEVVTVDGRRSGARGNPYPNGLLLADFFDFS